MKQSGIKVWLHVETMSIVLSWHCYGCVGIDRNEIQVPMHINVEAYQYIGEAIDNGNIVAIFHESYLDHFEPIGEL